MLDCLADRVSAQKATELALNRSRMIQKGAAGVEFSDSRQDRIELLLNRPIYSAPFQIQPPKMRCRGEVVKLG